LKMQCLLVVITNDLLSSAVRCINVRVVSHDRRSLLPGHSSGDRQHLYSNGYGPASSRQCGCRQGGLQRWCWSQSSRGRGERHRYSRHWSQGCAQEAHMLLMMGSVIDWSRTGRRRCVHDVFLLLLCYSLVISYSSCAHVHHLVDCHSAVRYHLKFFAFVSRSGFCTRAVFTRSPCCLGCDPRNGDSTKLR